MPAAPHDPTPARRSTDANAHSAQAPRSPAQRFRLSVLFCDLCDSTALSASLEAEDYAELLAALRSAYDSVVAQHGGTVVRVQGDGMLAVFGHPVPREGDGRRAVEAALQLHDAVRGFTAPAPGTFGREGLRLHSGIHAGMVLVQEGNLVIGRLELLGMVPNIAARLSANASRDEVLVSDETLGPARAMFNMGTERHVRVHGHEQPVACWPVLGRADPESSIHLRPVHTRTGFVGRQLEMQQLQKRLGEALAGATCQVAVAGPPGVGKTRLATELLRQAARKGCRVLKGYCEGELDATPMRPVRQLLRAALGVPLDADAAATAAAVQGTLATLELQALAPALQPLLGTALGHRGDAAPGGAERADRPDRSASSQPQEMLVPALARLFTALAEREPLLLFVDDWHWADAASRQALAAIFAAAQASGLMVLYSTRNIDAGDAHMRQVEVITLQPFSREEGAASIRALLPQVDPFIAEDIYRYSGGNALFIEELCHSAQHERPRLAGQQVGAAWLQVLIESRVARLPPELVMLVRTLAVLGNIVPAWLLASVTGLAPGDEALRELANKDFLFPDTTGTLRFKHGLTRDVIYESVGLHERRRLHRRIAEALQAHAARASEDPHESLAYHHGAAGQAVEAALHAELAGDRAAALSALDRAKAMYHAALVRLEAAGLNEARSLRWLNITNKLGLICVFDASRKDLPVFEQAVRLAQAQPDLSLRARAEYWLGYLLYGLGQGHDAVRHCERAAALAGPGDEPLAVQIRSTLGQAKAAASDYTGAQALLEDAVAIKRSHRRGSRPPVGLAYSLVCLASVAGDRGEFGQAHELLDEARELLNGATHEIAASIQGWRAVILGWQGRFADALAAAEESTQIAEQTHSLFQFCQGRATGAYSEWVLHGEVEAVERLAESTQWLAPRESGLFRSLDHGWLTEAWLARGERALARSHAAQALARARAGDLIGVALAWRALARDAAARQDFGRAARCLSAARRIAAARQSRHEAAANDLCAAELALARGEAGPARRFAGTAATAFEGMQMRWFAERAQALIARA